MISARTNIPPVETVPLKPFLLGIVATKTNFRAYNLMETVGIGFANQLSINDLAGNGLLLDARFGSS
jgi:hypothetical protein